MTDFLIINHGSIVTFKPLTEEAEAWCEEKLVGDDVMWFGGAVVVEPRYAEPIMEGIVADGLTVN
jgi:hypothetical protein